MSFNIQIPINYEEEWQKALPLISDKKLKEINRLMNQASKSRGWMLYGFSDSSYFFVKYTKIMRETISGYSTRKTIKTYSQMNRATGDVSYPSCNEPENFTNIYRCKEVKKFLDPNTNETMYANTSPHQVVRFCGVTKNKCIEKTYQVNVEEELNEKHT